MQTLIPCSLNTQHLWNIAGCARAQKYLSTLPPLNRREFGTPKVPRGHKDSQANNNNTAARDCMVQQHSHFEQHEQKHAVPTPTPILGIPGYQ